MADDPLNTENKHSDGNRGDLDHEAAPDVLERSSRADGEGDELVELHDDQSNIAQPPNQELGSVHYGTQVRNPQAEGQQNFQRQNAAAERQENVQEKQAIEQQTLSLDENTGYRERSRYRCKYFSKQSWLERRGWCPPGGGIGRGGAPGHPVCHQKY